MSDTEISDPHIGSLLALARERGQQVGGEAGRAIINHADNCAIVLQGYIKQMHNLANDPRLHVSDKEAGD